MTIPEIAAGLSEAQKKMLLAHSSTFGTLDHGWPASARSPESFQQAGRPLMDAGLISWTSNPRSSVTVLTNLGTMVGQHLQREGRG